MLRSVSKCLVTTVFYHLEACPTSKPYVVEKEVRRNLSPRRDLKLSKLVKGRRYWVDCCRPRDFEDPSAGFEHIASAFIFMGPRHVTTATGSVAGIIADFGNDHGVHIQAHVFGLTSFDGWGEDSPDGIGNGPSSQEYVGRWNHFSCVTLAPKH